MIYHTPDVLLAHYGSSVRSYRDVKGRIGNVYRTKGYFIMVQLLDGISQSELYAKEDGSPFSEGEAEAILTANAYGEKWEPVPQEITSDEGVPMQGWVILRTGTFCVYGPSRVDNQYFKHAISISTHSYVQHNKALDFN